MKKHKRVIALGVLLTMVMSLAACSGGEGGGEGHSLSKENAVDYVTGVLEESYLGVASEAYKQLVERDDDDVSAVYEASMEAEAEYFIYHYSIEEPTDELRKELKELCKEIYGHSKFQVVSAAEQDDGSFSVKVTVEPIDIAHLAEKDLEEAVKPWQEKYPTEVQDRMSEEELQAADAEWAEIIVNAFREKLPETGNLEEQSLSVLLEKDEDGYYILSQEEFNRLDALIIDYPYYEE